MNPSLALDGIHADSAHLGSLDCEVRRHLNITLGHRDSAADPGYLYRALAIAVRDHLVDQWLKTQTRVQRNAQKHVYYLSLEFLIGRSLSNAVHNLELDHATREVLRRYGTTLEEIAEQEHDAGLGNGGLGRLAACFLDSCANLDLPVVGYGIRYEYGMFHQRIENGRQVEEPDHWLLDGNPWELKRAEDTRQVHFYGRSELYYDEQGVHHCR